MPLPTPEPGLVISYAYLWRQEYRRGQEEGRKDRPCVIMILEAQEKNAPRITVAPITHSPPSSESVALLIPTKVKAHLGLDAAPSWMMLDEVNQGPWPGFDLRPIVGRHESYAYGFIPPKLFEAAKTALLQAHHMQKLHITPRD